MLPRELPNQLGIPIISHEIIDTLANKMRLRKSHVVRFLEGKANILERLTTDKLSDEAHGAIMRRHFGVDWHEPENYDLVLNTERVSIDECVEEVMNLVNHPDFQETDESHVKLDNLALAAKVRAALRLNPDTSKVQIAIEADSGVVTLSGIVDSNEQRRNAEQIAAGVPGVKDVRNKVRTITDANYKLDG